METFSQDIVSKYEPDHSIEVRYNGRMANNIKEIRKDRGLSQEQLANAVHTTKATISKLENGDIQLTMEWMRRLANVLECHWAEFGKDTRPTPQDEQAMIGLYRGLSEEQKKFAHRLVATLQEPLAKHESSGDGDNGDNGDNGTNTKKAG